MQAEEGELSVGLGGSTELRSLNEGATYEAWVAAHSAAGEGEPSAPQPATTTSRGKSRLIVADPLHNFKRIQFIKKN